MKKLFLLFTLLSFQSLAANSYVVSDLSSVSFVTIKASYVVEPAIISGLTGNLDKIGNFSINVPIKNIDTGISIRDDRLKSLFFDFVKNPVVTISGKFDLASLKQPISKVIVPAEVSFYGKNKIFNFPVVITKTDSEIIVSSYTPVIVKASDFNIPTDNLIKLASTVGDISLSNAVPVSINLIFNEL